VDGEETTGRPAGRAGAHPKGWNEEEVSAACRALRPGAAGLKGSVAHPTDGESYKQCDRAGAALARSPQLRKDTNPHRRIWPSARERQSAMLIVTGTDETRQGVGRSAAEIERRSRREVPNPFAQLVFSSHFDYILIGLIAGDRRGYRDKSIDRACPAGARGEG
jgi:hypothetical protein